MIDAHKGWNVSFKPLFIGYVLAVVLSYFVYRVAVVGHLKHNFFVVTMVGLASIQALIQLIFFMHLGVESKPRWNIIMFIYTAIVIGIIILGTMWIMTNLRYNVMT